MKKASKCLPVLLLFPFTLCSTQITPYNAQGEKAGEVGPTSVILHTRLTARPEAEPLGYVPGAPGRVCFELDTDRAFPIPRRTGWAEVGAETDFAHQETVDGLSPETEYFYRARLRSPGGRGERVGPVRRFRTAPPPEAARDVSFTVITGQAYCDRDFPEGFWSYISMLSLRPDFIVPTGDNVYYDNDTPPLGQNLESCRHHWHRIFALPSVRDFYGQVAGYWEMDDHDFRWDDADPHVDPQREPTPETGIKVFREQVPMGGSTYRTVRWGKRLHVFLPEGRLYRDRNDLPDTPEKSIWGEKQKEWLLDGIRDSDADFKVLVSPTPLVGPDYSETKRDNHVNVGGFSREGAAIFRRLRDRKVKNFYIVCGDRHWQYHSIHPSGYEEFCCGALSDPHASSRPVIPIPGIKQAYLGLGVGGFLRVRVAAGEGSQPEIAFDFYNSRGRVQYSQTRTLR